MPIGRNDPCPCGSGKKYKQCHGTPADTRRLPLPADAVVPDLWEVDLVPLLAGLEDNPGARLVAVMVVAGEEILHGEVVDRPPAEPEQLAPVIAAALTEAITVAGKSPTRVHLRHESVARALSPLVAPQGIAVAATRELPAAAEASRHKLSHLSGGDQDLPPTSSPRSWDGWQLAEAQIARLFAASAAYFVAVRTGLDTRNTAADSPIRANFPDGNEWYAAALTEGDKIAGLGLYGSLEDFEDLFAYAEPRITFAEMRDVMISMTFGTRDALDPVMRKEIRRASWEVAGAEAYPVLLVLGTPGGGITERQAEDLITLLGAVPRFLGAGVTTDSWTDPQSGVTLTSVPVGIAAGDRLWPFAEEPAISGPEGPGARPGARIAGSSDDEIATLKERLLDAFLSYMFTLARLSRAVAERHARAVEPFLDFLLFGQQMPAEAITEFHLREFLYRWYPLKSKDAEAEARGLPGALTVFFDFMERALGVRCAWAESILSNEDAFMRRWQERRDNLGYADDEDRWLEELTVDHEARLFLPTDGLDTGIEWRNQMGEIEATLYDEVSRLWLVWRDELIRDGVTHWDDLEFGLIDRVEVWARAPNALVKGKAPARAIAREQARLMKR